MRMIVLLTTVLLSWSALANDAGLLTQAASERMLVERIAKTYVLRGLEPDNTQAQQQYTQAAEQFERQLANLRDATRHDAELSDNYALLNQLWGDYKTLTSAPTTHEGATQLADLSEDIAWIAQKGGQMIEQRGGSEAKPVRIAEDIATLSQRLAKIYLLQSYGAKRDFLPKDLAAARAEFQTLDQQLKSLPDHHGSHAQLSVLDSQWLFFQQAIDELAKHNTDPQLRRNVVTTSEHIFELAQTLAADYQPTLESRR